MVFLKENFLATTFKFMLANKNKVKVCSFSFCVHMCDFLEPYGIGRRLIILLYMHKDPFCI